MSSTYEPMSEVRKNFKIDWYRCPIDSKKLREFTRRSDLKGWLQTLGWLAIVAATGTSTWLFFLNEIWVGFGIALFLHGTAYSFNPGLVTHELSHGTVFKTKKLNWFFLRFFSLLGLVNFHHYKRSHTYHHLYTLHPRGDREVVLPGNPSLKPIWLLMLFTINIPGMWQVIYRNTIRPAIFGKLELKGEWSRAIFPEEDREGRKEAINWARILLAFHIGVLIVAAVTGLWLLPVLITLPNFIASWWRYFIGITMHTGLRDNVADFRKCCRTIKLDPLSQFLYWHMNFHTEHHMYAAIPCYNLPKLSREIAWDMPEPRSLIEAWKEMRYTYKRQQTEPDYQFDTPVPENGSNGGEAGSHRGKTRGAANRVSDTADEESRELSNSIGDIEPENMK